MSELSLNEGQEFHAGGKRFVIRGGVPVQEEKRGPLGGELVRFGSLKKGDRFALVFEKLTEQINKCVTPGFKESFNNDDVGVLDSDLVEINVPQQAQGRVMTAGEAARLPDIVGKRVNCVVSCVDTVGRPLCLDFADEDGMWISSEIKIEVLD